MSPDSSNPTKQRRAWRAMACAGCVLGAASLFVTAVKFNGTDERAQKAVCAVVSYAERQADTIRQGMPAQNGQPARPGNPKAAEGLEKLATDMRATGISCPSRE